MLFEVRPTYAPADLGYAALPNVKLLGEDSLSFCRLADVSYCLFSQRLHRTASSIHRLRNKFQMIWIDTRMNFTEMIENEPKWRFTGWYRAAIKFVIEAMGLLSLPTSLYKTIPANASSKLPNPARCFVATIFRHVIDRRKSAGMAYKETFRLTLYASSNSVITVIYFGGISAPAMAGTIRNIHASPSSGKVAAVAGRLQPLEVV